MSERHIAWQDAYALGLATIDTQHRHLFDIVNKIYSLKKNDHLKEDIKTVLIELNDYMREHFDDEEQYMRQIGYPDLEAHRLLHAHIIEQLTQFVKTPNHRLDILRTKMRVMAKRILIDHIIDEDMKIKRYLEQSPELREDAEDIIEL